MFLTVVTNSKCVSLWLRGLQYVLRCGRLICALFTIFFGSLAAAEDLFAGPRLKDFVRR